MANFVLVAGARLGAWAWDEVVQWLRGAGHGVRPLTLSGLAEKKHVPAGQQIHVQDIVDEVERHDLREVVLVGHSYAGVPVGQAAERIGDRLARVVFVDATVPVDGEPFVSAFPDGGVAVTALITANDGWWPPVAAAHYDGHGLSGGQVGRILAGSTPHPGASMTEPAVLDRSPAELPTTYISCRLTGAELPDDVATLLTSDRWSLAELDTGHWPMFSQPRELAELLLASARSGPVTG